ncbi:MAG TPA: TetR/AcrR family transcriptional regulator [Candidatus Polarisedimenticolaceae bacterium]|nr:TetR/AcrR family transcriptional regulator [Candidatus Polarisedimenticolaceae bacterium]
MNSVRGPNTLRERISAAAQELFLAEGVDGVSMRKVADRVGVTAPAIYRHFKDKDELLSEIINVGLMTLQRYLEPAFRAERPFDRLQRMIEYYLDFALEQPRYFDFAFLVPSHGIELTEELARHNRSTFMFAVQQVHLCMEQGVFVKSDPLETAIMVWAEAHGLVTLFRLERFGQDPEQFRGVFRRTIQRLLDGLKTGA